MIKEFNLLREKWVLVLDSKGNSREVSLIEAFQAAYIIKCLAGELQAQDIAVLRLMLAVLYSVFTRVSIDGDYKELTNERQAVNRWVDLWKSRRFSIELIEDYLNRYSERFYLFHEHTPFYQVPITVNIGTEFAAAKLIGDLAESANKPNVFAERARSLKNGVTYSEAVRWLLYLNAYDDISVSPKLRKGLGIGRLGKLGLVYAAGDNLFETLMLNFSLLSDQNERFRPGKAVWEKELYITDRALVKTPASPAELLTLQSRRISLLRDNGTVTGYKLYGGDIMNEENAFIEHMTRWGKDDDEKRDVYKPKRLNPYKPLWRKFPALIMNTEKTKRPGVIEWLAVLTKKGLISGNIGLKTAGVKYKDLMPSAVVDVFNDSIIFNSALLVEGNIEWVNRINEQLEMTQNYIYYLYIFIKNLQKASGGGNDSLAELARDQAYFDIDGPFRTWIAKINPETDDTETTIKAWDVQAKNILTDIADLYLENTGESAILGRNIVENKKQKFISAANAYAMFRASINKKNDYN